MLLASESKLKHEILRLRRFWTYPPDLPAPWDSTTYLIFMSQLDWICRLMQQREHPAFTEVLIDPPAYLLHPIPETCKSSGHQIANEVNRNLLVGRDDAPNQTCDNERSFKLGYHCFSLCATSISISTYVHIILCAGYCTIQTSPAIARSRCSQQCGDPITLLSPRSFSTVADSDYRDCCLSPLLELSRPSAT